MNTSKRAQRAITDDDEPRRAVSSTGLVGWSATSRRTKLIAIALAVLFAVITFTVVSRTWSGGATLQKARGPVEVRLMPPAAPSR